MSFLIVALLFPLLALAQSTFLWGVLPGGATPDLVLLLTLVCGLRKGAAAGSAAGLWGGTLVAALAGSVAAPVALCYGLAGWLVGLHTERGARPSTFPLAGIAVMVLLAVLQARLSSVWGQPVPELWRQLLYLAWNSVLCLALAGVRRAK